MWSAGGDGAQPDAKQQQCGVVGGCGYCHMQASTPPQVQLAGRHLCGPQRGDAALVPAPAPGRPWHGVG